MALQTNTNGQARLPEQAAGIAAALEQDKRVVLGPDMWLVTDPDPATSLHEAPEELERLTTYAHILGGLGLSVASRYPEDIPARVGYRVEAGIATLLGGGKAPAALLAFSVPKSTHLAPESRDAYDAACHITAGIDEYLVMLKKYPARPDMAWDPY